MKKQLTRIWVPSKVKLRIKVLSAREGMSIQKYMEKHFCIEEEERRGGGFRGIF